MNDFELEEFLNKKLPKKHFFTTTELVKLGLYGSRTAVRKDISDKKIENLWISERRMVIVRESLIKNIIKLNNKPSDFAKKEKEKMIMDKKIKKMQKSTKDLEKQESSLLAADKKRDKTCEYGKEMKEKKKK